MDNKQSNYVVYAFSLIVAIIVVHFSYGLSILNPTNVSWLMSAYHDWGTHYLGWAFYRNEPWTFPIGTIHNYNYPAGTNIGFTDSIPLLAIIFKPFSSFLPEDFQYFGIWLLVCFYLVGIYSYKILKLYIEDTRVVLISILFIILNPVLMYRGMHPALCGHWLILASIHNYLIKTNSENVNNINKNQVILLLISSLVNPYLFLMIVAFNFIIPFKNYYYEKTLKITKFIFYPLISIVIVVFVWFFIGLLTFNNNKEIEVVDSYGLYGFNLNGFYNPSGYSKFLPELKWQNHHQYEGFSYIGIGMMFLLIFSIFIFFSKKYYRFFKKQYIPLIFLVFFSIVFAVTNKISYGDKIIYEYPTLEIVKKIGNIFRASGRFIWIFYYLIFLFSLIIFLKSKISKKIKIVLLSLFFAIQIYDISLLITFRNLPSGNYNLLNFDKEWFDFTSNFDKIIIYPPFQFSTLNEMDYQDLCYIALKNNKPITTAYVARESGDINVLFSNDLSKKLSEGKTDENSLYITTQNNIEDFYPAIYKNKLTLRYLNGYYLIFKNKKFLKYHKNSIEQKKTDSINGLISNNIKPFDIKKPNFINNQIKYYIEKINDSENLQIKGWAFLKNSKNNLKDSIFIILVNNNKTYLNKVRLEKRPDITSTYPQGNLDNSGFRSTILKTNIEQGIYDLGIAIKDSNSKLVYEIIEPKIIIKVKTYNKIEEAFDLSKYTNVANGNIDFYEETDDIIKIRGWSVNFKDKSKKRKIKLGLKGIRNNYIVEVDAEIRKDITNTINDGNNYDNSGFNVEIDKSKIKKGQYELIIISEGETKSVFKTDKVIKL